MKMIRTVLLSACFVCAAISAKAQDDASFGSVYQWKEEGHTVTAWIDPDVRAKVIQPGESRNTMSKSLPMGSQQGKIILSRVDSALAVADNAQLLPVLRSAPNSAAPYRIPTGGVIVETTDRDGLHAWVNDQRLTLTPSAITGFWIVATPAGQAALDVAQQLSQLPGVTTAYPSWTTPHELN